MIKITAPSIELVQKARHDRILENLRTKLACQIQLIEFHFKQLIAHDNVTIKNYYSSDENMTAQIKYSISNLGYIVSLTKDSEHFYVSIPGTVTITNDFLIASLQSAPNNS